MGSSFKTGMMLALVLEVDIRDLLRRESRVREEWQLHLPWMQSRSYWLNFLPAVQELLRQESDQRNQLLQQSDFTATSWWWEHYLPGGW